MGMIASANLFKGKKRTDFIVPEEIDRARSDEKERSDDPQHT